MDSETSKFIMIVLAIAVVVLPLCFIIRRRRQAAGIDAATGNRQTAIVSDIIMRFVPLILIGLMLTREAALSASAYNPYAYLFGCFFVVIGFLLLWRSIRRFRRLSQEAYARKNSKKGGNNTRLNGKLLEDASRLGNAFKNDAQ